MCGIIALLRRPAALRPVDLTPLVGQLTNAADRLAGDGESPNWEMLGEAIEAAGFVDEALRGLNGAAALLAKPQQAAELKLACERLDALAVRIETAEAEQ